jgi:hypothetical protein
MPINQRRTAVQLHSMQRTETVSCDSSTTYTRADRLPSVDGMLPESWLLYECQYLQDTYKTAAVSHR